jgi:hypothetical protein
MKRSLLVPPLLAAVAVMAAGCATPMSWRYTPKTRPGAPTPVLDKSVAVLPFEDARSHIQNDYRTMFFVPLMPFGWQTLDRPDVVDKHMTSGRWVFNPTEDLARAWATELAGTGLFRRVEFMRRPIGADLIFEGRILSTRYKGFLFSYAHSVVGMALWLVGAPASHVTNTLELELTLKDATTGQVLWRAEFLTEMKRADWVYYLRPDFNYEALFEDVVDMALPDLAEVVRAYARGTPLEIRHDSP